MVNPSGNLVPSTSSEEPENQDPKILIEQSDEGNSVDNLDPECNEISAILESNELVIDGVRGDALV